MEIIIDSLNEALYLFSKLIPIDTSGYGKELKYTEDSELDFVIINGKPFIRDSQKKQLLTTRRKADAEDASD